MKNIAIIGSNKHLTTLKELKDCEIIVEDDIKKIDLSKCIEIVTDLDKEENPFYNEGKRLIKKKIEGEFYGRKNKNM